ncbi:hypothetical protein FTUN_4267 [Frigoriglobus tundricola]|uniref:Uncharacterized protein n=1 Tax=Frigoriglobus tundricola TaxID=2774151 RepID=A0A6M5YRT2_9BACT|nr:hypothetical protein FTUN_4267 [Frigoriglobus tundricola]
MCLEAQAGKPVPQTKKADSLNRTVYQAPRERPLLAPTEPVCCTD